MEEPKRPWMTVGEGFPSLRPGRYGRKTVLRTNNPNARPDRPMQIETGSSVSSVERLWTLPGDMS
eukprot:6164652-Pyramimonas_sp.AAC.1